MKRSKWVVQSWKEEQMKKHSASKKSRYKIRIRAGMGILSQRGISRCLIIEVWVQTLVELVHHRLHIYKSIQISKLLQLRDPMNIKDTNLKIDHLKINLKKIALMIKRKKKERKKANPNKTAGLEVNKT